jgi:hypothetical protein
MVSIHTSWGLAYVQRGVYLPLQDGQYVEDRQTPVSRELSANVLLGDDSVFDDLKISKQDYPKVPTTW